MAAPITKECTKCHRVLAVENFYKKSASKSGYATQCKTCCAYTLKKWQEKNKEKIKQDRHRYYIENKERARATEKEWQARNPKRARVIKKRWDENNKDKIKAYSQRPEVKAAQKKAKRERYLANREKVIEAARLWVIANPTRAKETRRRLDKKRRANPKAKISNSVSCGIRDSLRNKSKANRHWETLVDFTIDQLKRHLESKFDSKMTWENYGTYWQIDHKIPIAAFNFATPNDIDFKRCWSLFNLQPLEATQNASKGARVDRDFQPSLALAVGGNYG
jgi:hypothetical protein